MGQTVSTSEIILTCFTWLKNREHLIMVTVFVLLDDITGRLWVIVTQHITNAFIF